jgi:glycosyltransferase involved in cell wall biosynthesis
VSRVLVITPRFGAFAGGAEALLAAYAHLLDDAGHAVEIATTCALDHHTWANEVAAGTKIEDGLKTHRFEIELPPRTRGACPSSHVFTDELRWFGDSMWCPELSEYLRREAASYDALIAGPYLFGTTLWSVLEHPQQCILVPCLHDEAEAHTKVVGQMLRSAQICAFNSEPELALARRLHGNDVSGVVIGIGLDPTPVTTEEVLHDLPADFIVYCGRMEEGKGANRVIDQVREHNTRHPEAPIDLVMIGGGPLIPPPDPRIHAYGYVSETAKRTTLSRAKALVSFSRMESLSIVALEAWREGTPVITGSDCEVLRWQVERSDGGIVIETSAQFSKALATLADPSRRNQLGTNGARLLQTDYQAEEIMRRLVTAITTVERAADRR